MKSLNIRDPQVVGKRRVQKLSLIETGMPDNRLEAEVEDDEEEDEEEDDEKEDEMRMKKRMKMRMKRKRKM